MTRKAQDKDGYIKFVVIIVVRKFVIVKLNTVHIGPKSIWKRRYQGTSTKHLIIENLVTERKRGSGFRCVFTVAFLIFLANAGDPTLRNQFSNPAWLSLTYTPYVKT